MTRDDNHRSNTNLQECLHTYCSTVCEGVLEVRCKKNYCMLELEIPNKHGWDCKLLAKFRGIIQLAYKEYCAETSIT